MENLKWKSVELIDLRKNIKDEYLMFIYQCFQDYKTRSLFTNDMYIKSLEDFLKDFRKKMIYKYHEFMIIKSINSSSIVGFIYSYKYNPNDGTLYVTQYIQPQNRGSFYAIESCLVFYDYLFNKYSIRKIYCSTYNYNEISMSILQGAGFILEGKLKKCKYYCGKYYDMLIYALYKEKFNEIKKKFKK